MSRLSFGNPRAEVSSARGWGSLHTQLVAADDLSLVRGRGGGIALQRDQAGIDSVNDPLGIREEVLVELVRRSDPVARADDDGRRIQIVEAHIRQVLRDLVEEGASCAGVGGQDHAAGLLDGSDQIGIIQRDQRRHVDDVGFHAVLLGERLGCVDCAVQRRADGEDGQILAVADLVDSAGCPFILFRGNAALVEFFALAVDTLGLEDDAGIGAVQSRLHDTLGLVWGGREEDLQAGDVGDDGDPVLRVLRAVLGTDGHTQDHRHLQDTGRHGLPLGHLVEDLVACTAKEVAVHELDDCAAAAHAVTDGGADDGSLGDRRVEESGVRNDIHQAAVDSISAAPVTHVFAIGDERRVFVVLVDQRLKDRVADVVDLHVGELIAVLIEREVLLLGQVSIALAALLRASNVQLLIGSAHGADGLVGEHQVCKVIRVLVEVDIRRDLLVVSRAADHGHAVSGFFFKLAAAIEIYTLHIVGSVVAAAFGMVDFSPVASKGWLGLPTFLPYGPFTFDWKIFIPFFIAYMVAVMEALGVYQAASEIQGTPLERKQVRYGLAGEAAGSAISSLIGGFTTTAYPQNVGLLNLTGEGKLRTRTPVIIAAVLLLILGFVPKAGALLSVIPSAVVGGIFLPAAASLIVTGLRALRKVADDERRQTVIGMSLLLGIALPKALSGLTGGASVFFGNNIMVGVFSAIILNALFVALPDLVAKHRAPASVDVPAADPADGTGAAAYDER